MQQATFYRYAAQTLPSWYIWLLVTHSNMSWTERLQKLEPFYVGETQKTRVFTYPATSDHGDAVVVKEIACADEAAAQKAEREAEFSKVHRHPHIHQCVRYEKEANPQGGFFVYIFSAPMPKSLYDELVERSRSMTFFPEEELWTMYNQMLDAFSYLQDIGIAHRDIKPANILFDAQGQVKVCDFGFAKKVNLQDGGPSTLLMTLAYSSPALRNAYLMGGRYQVEHDVFKSDVFSLGMTLAHLSVLELPRKIGELPELQNFIDTQLDLLTRRYSEKWVNLLRLMLRVEECQRPDFHTLKIPSLYADDEYLPQAVREDEIPPPLELTAKCGNSYVRVSHSQVDEVPCMITLKALTQDPNMRTYGMDLMCVIDQSGSMAGFLINLVKASLIGLLDKLGDRDRVSFVGFNNTAERICPLIRCTAEGKARLRPMIEAFRCSGGTSIARGFLMGLEVLKRRQCCNDAASLFLFSDGQNNSDGDPTDPCTSALQQCGLKKLSVSTFGYSGELDSKLLEALASIGKGQFFHITQHDQIPQVFALAICNATSVVARKLTVSMRLLSGKVNCDITKIYAKNAANVFELPDIHANELKELVFMIKPHHEYLEKQVAYPVVEVNLNFEDNDDTESCLNCNLVVKFVKWEGNSQASEDSGVYRHWFRVRGADYLREARELANAQRFQEADNVLGRGIEALRAGSCAKVLLVQSVIHDMEEARKLVRSSDTWQQGGDPHFASISYSHFSQAATALSLQYASRQQAELPVIRERRESNASDS